MPLPSTHAATTAETDASTSTALATIPAVVAAVISCACVAEQRRTMLASTPDAVEASNITKASRASNS